MNLDIIISNAYFGNKCSDYAYVKDSPSIFRYMPIPITDDIFEVPVEAMSVFYDSYSITTPSYATFNDLDTICLPISYQGKKNLLKSPNAIIKQFFNCGYLHNGLCKYISPDAKVYYGGNGIILNTDFKPQVMLTWKMQRQLVTTSDSQPLYRYYLLKPVMRIAPEVFAKEDNIQRYIASKLLSIGTTLSDILFRISSSSSMHSLLISKDVYPRVEVIIDDFPFEIQATDTPSIDTTSTELCTLAKQHVNEILWV